MGENLDKVWREVIEVELDWLKQVLLGEFDDHQTPGGMIAQLLVSFTPGAVIVMSARDLLAVTIRMVRFPAKRHETTEWMLLIACLLGIVPALVGAVVGTAGTLVGTAIGGLVGDEAGAALRATCILLIEDGSRMLEKVVEFLRGFVHGDLLRFLRDVKFIKYAEPVYEEFSKFLKNIISIMQKLVSKLDDLRWTGQFKGVIETLQKLEADFHAIDELAASKIPEVMRVFDTRLERALAEHMTQADHVVHPNLPAPLPQVEPPKPPRRVVARGDTPLGKAEGLEDPGTMPAKVEAEKNLHPQGVETEPRKVAHYLHRPYIRKGVRKEVEARARRAPDGRFLDPNTGKAIDGKYDLGHVPGHEFWREQQEAEQEGLTQAQFNDRMNNPDYYQIEDPSSNRSHEFEQKGP